MNNAKLSRAHGPGDLTVSAMALFTLGAYGVAAGSVTNATRAVALGVFALTLFVIGIVWPIVTLARVSVSCQGPSDATVGDVVPLRVELHGRAARVELRILDPAGAWVRTATPATGTISHIAQRRGVFTHVRVQLRTSAPLGVFVRVRQARVPLPQPITIAPRPLSARPALGPIPENAELPSERSGGHGAADVVRSVRPYVPGDAARLVHWPTSARRGELIVREHDPPGNIGVALVVDLSGPDDWAEEAARVAAGVGRAALARGGQVVLATREAGGAVCARVGDPRELGRRLARAVAGVPADPPGGWPVQHVRAVDTAESSRAGPVVHRCARRRAVPPRPDRRGGSLRQ
ncbi:MAG: DUF58 domain-containing protein [Actinomycetota bacterium]